MTEVAHEHKALIHRKGDHVAVAIVNIRQGDDVLALYMDDDDTVELKANHGIPLGHKIALVDLPEGAELIEYGVRVALTKAPISRGDLVHVHNIRSARWNLN